MNCDRRLDENKTIDNNNCKLLINRKKQLETLCKICKLNSLHAICFPNRLKIQLCL